MKNLKISLVQALMGVQNCAVFVIFLSVKTYAGKEAYLSFAAPVDGT